MKLVTVYKGKLKTYKVRNKMQGYKLALASYRALYPDNYYRMLLQPKAS